MAIKKYIAAMMFFSGGCTAQTDSIANPYIEEFPDKISVQVSVLNTSNKFSIDYREEKVKLDLVPNQKTTINFALQYDIVSVSFGIAPKFFANNNDSNKGSKMTAFSFSLFPKRWMQHFDLYYQKGLTLNATDMPSIYFPELKTLKVGGSTSYIFNEKFSFQALAFQNARQLKSAGTFAPSLSYYYTELNGNKVEGIDGTIYFIDVALAPAYNYNWVISKNFLVAGGLSLGGGITRTVDEDENYTSFLTQASLSISLGYNSDSFYGGVYSKGIVSNYDTESHAAMDDAISYATAFLGYRFDAPSYLQKERKKIKEKL